MKDKTNVVNHDHISLAGGLIKPRVYVDVSLMSEDGTEYLINLRGGGEIETIDNIPAGPY